MSESRHVPSLENVPPMELAATEIADVKLLKPVRHLDARGFFSEVFRADTLQEHGIERDYVQDNHSLSVEEGVVRGLHFQIQPFAQAKLVRVTAGAILDIPGDIRRRSPTYRRPVAIVVTRAAWDHPFHPPRVPHRPFPLIP